MGGETVFKPFVIIFTVILLMTTMMMMLQHMAIAATQIDQPMQNENAVGDYDTILITPNTGYVVTTAKTVNEMEHPTKANFIFTDNGSAGGLTGDNKYVQVVRNNKNYDPSSTDMWKKYNDFVSIQRKTGISPLTPLSSTWNGAAIPLSAFVSAFDPKTNTSKVGFELSGNNDTIFLHLASNDTGLIWVNSYTMYYGWSMLREGKVNFWGTIGLLMTAKMPGMNPVLSLFISGMFWAVICFMIFTMVSRIIPFIPGG